ncbi:MAG TPA: CAP domain-containing protein [Acidimicrobiales bacterium]|nr:CAP domain-containing protein [Acidimicrobiales bacterium]
MTERRSPRIGPLGLVAAFLLVCAAPLAAVVATGFQREHPGGDRTETAADAGESSTTEADASSTTAHRDSPPGTGTADIPPPGHEGAGGSTTTTTRGGSATDSAPAPGPADAPLPTFSDAPPAPTTTAPLVVAAPPDLVVVLLVNQARAKASPACPALKVETHLTKAAQSHSDDMAARDYFSHDTPEGVTFDQRIKQAGYPRPGGENIAEGQRSAQEVMTAWMNSDGHRKNILNCSFTTIGVGVNTGKWIWTQDFGY